MPDDLYHRDILAWSEAQAARLRRLAAGERVNDVDWEHVIEEIGDLGKSQLQSVESPLLQALIHALKSVAWPDHMARRKWRNEMVVFLADARRRFQPGMAGAIDVAAIHHDAMRVVSKLDMRRPAAPLPTTTNLTVAELMDHALDADALIARLATPG